ncbi:MAG: selenocysteine-specific elongation factor, partial [Thermoleophilaceae bacterium]|nr:selenocysteine-specific elongation factor [Thermoleophilaceae bacterium]
SFMILGTAGHIDHGKTALVRALTGVDTDRLPEEKRRGITIDLGFAPLTLEGIGQIGVVDVPGHEAFVRTMVAGATGVDMFLLCVAADDGVMPQTREHMAVLRQLGVSEGVVAVTKSDVGEPDLAAEEAAELVPGAPIVQVSALRQSGLDDLVAALGAVASRLPGRAGVGVTRLHVDRSFTLRGIGTVVTGTLWAGSLGAGDVVRVLPRGLEARVRSVQVHDVAVERASAGQRVALNLVGVGWRDVGRGDVVVVGDGLRPGYLLDVAVAMEEGARPLERGMRLQVHHGTREAPARVVPLGGGFAQVRLEAPLVAAAGDRLILRQVAPPDTIGGGVVVDASPRKHGPSDELVARLARGEVAAPDAPVVEEEPDGAPDPEPLDDAALAVASLLRSDGFTPRADGDLAEAAGIDPAAAARAFSRLERAGEAVRVGRNLHFHPESLAVLEAQVVAICERDGEATIAGLRDELGTSRKYAQALLEHLDRTKVTLRRGDAHVLRRRRSP